MRTETTSELGGLRPSGCAERLREEIDGLVRAATDVLRGEELVLASFAGEDSDFVRWNRSRVRQAGSVRQRSLALDLVRGRRHATAQLTLSSVADVDRGRVRAAVTWLRERVAVSPEDPHLLWPEDVTTSDRTLPGALPERAYAMSETLRAGKGRDLAGIYAAGYLHRGFASSLGHRHWHSAPSFHLDASFHAGPDRAVKTGYAGAEWLPAEFERRLTRATAELEAITRPERPLEVGRYRVYLAPSAVEEILEIVEWGGFGLQARRTRTAPLLAMIDGGAKLHPSVTLVERPHASVAPHFQEQGFLRSAEVTLVRRGELADALVSPRSAAEYGVATNGASAGESPVALEMDGGELPEAGVLAAIGEGVWIGNLWYLNFSDRSAGRITGMTRFATFRVEKGELAGPVRPMRFDETVFRILGKSLAGITREREMLLDGSTYGGRSTRSRKLPGILVEDFPFTL